jgi:hypothetical protein
MHHVSIVTASAVVSALAWLHAAQAQNQPARPQFSAVFTDWNFAPRIADSVFTPELPAGAEKIQFAPAVASASQK